MRDNVAMENDALTIESLKQEIPNVFWKDDEAVTVGEFLAGRTRPVEANVDIAKKLNAATKMDERRDGVLILYGKGLIQKTQPASPVAPDDEYGKIQTREEYEFVNRELSRTVMRVMLKAVEDEGLLPDIERKFIARGKLRKEGEAKYSSQKKWIKDQLVEQWTELAIKAPEFEYKSGEKTLQRKFDSDRLRRSLAHETAHIYRGVFNSLFWSRLPVELSSQLGLKEAETEIGGYMVGGNESGAEEIGNLLTVLVAQKAAGGEVTIDGLIPAFAAKVEENLTKPFSETKIRMPLTAGLDHLMQLSRLGYGNLSGLRLVALGLLGYVSLEKMPTLIGAGMVDQKMLDSSEKVLEKVIDWLSAQS